MTVEAMTEQDLRWEVFSGAKAGDAIRWSEAVQEWRGRLEAAHRNARGPRPDRMVGVVGELPSTATGLIPTTRPCRRCGLSNDQPCERCDA